ncbi:MAG: hypothetical protein U0172_06300 [Nitrospiraceae bacterium]
MDEGRTATMLEPSQQIEQIQPTVRTRRAIGAWAIPMSSPEIEGVATAVPARCPKCGQVSGGCNRLQWPDLLRRVVGARPWKCPTCLYRFYLNRRH